MRFLLFNSAFWNIQIALTSKWLTLSSHPSARAGLQLYEHFMNNPTIQTASFPAVIHPSAVVGAAVTSGRGLHVSPLSVIAPYASLGDFVVINRNVSLGSPHSIRKFCHP